MFTSRAEYRILLRQDNADQRLTPIGFQLGLIPSSQYKAFQKKYRVQNQISGYLRDHLTDYKNLNALLEARKSSPISHNIRLAQLLLRPEIRIDDMTDFDPNFQNFLKSVKATREQILNAETSIKYESYIQKEEEMVARMSNLDSIKIDPNTDYNQMPSLANEAKEKLMMVKPSNLGQASRISGVNPADITALMIFLRT